MTDEDELRAVLGLGPRPTTPAERRTVRWRAWLATEEGLIPPYVSLDPCWPLDPWRPGINVARCNAGGVFHMAPIVDCECGIRGVDNLGRLYRALDLRSLKNHPMGPRYFEGRWTVEDLGAVGEVELSGRIIGRSACDPLGTSRASHARLLRLYVVPRLAYLVSGLVESLDVPVKVGLPGRSACA